MVCQIVITDSFILVAGTLAMLLIILMLILFAFLFQRKMLNKQQAYREIEKLLQKEELKSAYALIEGKELERKRIAEDLHDNIGSILATLRMYSDLLYENDSNPDIKRFSEKISQLTEQAAAETRRISHDLDSGTIKYFGLKPAVETLCEAIHNSHKIMIDSVLDVTPELEGNLSLNVYRIVQELFNNALKHAQATLIRLEISQIDNEYLSIIFEDNGKGFDVSHQTNGIGLKNIRTRTERFKGTLNIDSRFEKGTTCIIEIPIQ